MAFWMNAKFNSRCAECENDIVEGDRIVFDPDAKNPKKKGFCAECGVEVVGPDPQKVKAEESKELERVRKARKMYRA